MNDTQNQLIMIFILAFIKTGLSPAIRYYLTSPFAFMGAFIGNTLLFAVLSKIYKSYRQRNEPRLQDSNGTKT